MAGRDSGRVVKKPSDYFAVRQVGETEDRVPLFVFHPRFLPTMEMCEPAPEAQAVALGAEWGTWCIAHEEAIARRWMTVGEMV
jgi:hypothetical protein